MFAFILSRFQFLCLHSANVEDKADLYRTPERIELENIRLAVANDLEVWSEEEIVKHNLMGGVSASEAFYVEEDGYEKLSYYRTFV